MTISNLIGSRLLSGIAGIALTGSLFGGAAIAASPDKPVQELRHDVRDQTKAQRDEIKQLRAEFAAEYVKDQPSTAKLKRLDGAIAAKQAEIKAMRFDALLKMHDILDAKQREKMAARMSHDGKGKKGHGERGDDDRADGERPDKADAKAKRDREHGPKGERGSETAGKGEAKAKQAKAKDKDKGKDKGKDKDKADTDERRANESKPV